MTTATAGLILILKDGKPRQEIDLVVDQCLSMGKSPNNSIILPDKGIRSEHIKLQVDSQGQAFFDSLGHQNVLVNSRLGQGPVQLKDGDLIEVLRKHDGPRQFVYYSTSAAQQTAARRKSLHQQHCQQLDGSEQSEVQPPTGGAAVQCNAGGTPLQQQPQQKQKQNGQLAKQQPRQHFAAPPPAPPPPTLPGGQAHARQADPKPDLHAALQQQLKQRQKQTKPSSEAQPFALPPQPPPVPPLPWAPEKASSSKPDQAFWQRMLQQQQHTEQLHKQQQTNQMHQHAPASQSGQESRAVASAVTDTSARQAVAPVSDMHKLELVAQAVAAAALTRQSQHQSQQQQQHLPLLQQQLQSKSRLLLQQDAATQADLPPASQATLEQHLAEQAAEMQILQEQNDRLRAQVRSLQQQLTGLQTASSVQDAVMAQAEDTEELVEPTLVLPSPSKAVPSLSKVLPSPSKVMPSPSKVMPTDLADPSFATITALSPARHSDNLHAFAVHTQQDKQRGAAKPTAQPALADEDALQLRVMDSLAAAHGQAAAVDTDNGLNSLPGVAQDEGAQHAPADEEERLSHTVPSSTAQRHQAQEMASDCKPLGEAVQPVDAAGLVKMSQAVAIPAYAASGELPQDSSKLVTQHAGLTPSGNGPERRDGDHMVSSQLRPTSIPAGHATHSVEHTSILDRQPCTHEGHEAIAKGQVVLPEGLGTTAHGQAASHENQQIYLPSQSTLPEGQSTKPDRHADGQASSADGQDTISDACCVCHSGEDGEIMLLCDTCDKPAHLGCVGMEAVPEGDWFCPACTAIMAKELRIQAQQCGQGQTLQQRSGVEDVIGPDHSGADAKAPGKRLGAPVAGSLECGAVDKKGSAGLPVKKRSRRTISDGKAQQNKENAAANQPAVKRRRQSQCPARAVKKAAMCAMEMNAQGPRRSTRLADK
ncbi:hypothetical protein WJX77_002149 [Trebouxia sp. C0004]